jgi:hypothetical protein
LDLIPVLERVERKANMQVPEDPEQQQFVVKIPGSLVFKYLPRFKKTGSVIQEESKVGRMLRPKKDIFSLASISRCVEVPCLEDMHRLKHRS